MVYPQKMAAEIAGVGINRGQPYLYWAGDQEEVLTEDFSKSIIQDRVYADVYAQAFGFVNGNDMWRWLDCAEIGKRRAPPEPMRGTRSSGRTHSPTLYTDMPRTGVSR